MKIKDETGYEWEMSIMIDGCDFVVDYLCHNFSFQPTSIEDMVDGFIFVKKDSDGVDVYTATAESCKTFFCMCDIWEKHPQLDEREISIYLK